ncbi:MAG: glutamate synthase large subunit, partial [Alphaproteobacteria bacterium]|nr:glutamate synthase large subunit [Alphaproteobacteria bacterium]
SLVSLIGPRPNLLDLETGGSHKRLEVKSPILSNVDLEKIRHIHEKVDNAFRTYSLNICYAADLGAAGLEGALDRICMIAKERVLAGYNIIVLSDRAMDADHIAVPSLLATAAVHHHLIREGLRTEVGIVVETGEARQVHDFCLLGGYGAEAINPYLAFETLSAIRSTLKDGPDGAMSEEKVHANYVKAVNKGVLKVMSKMGISTFQSYCGAQIFDAVGLSTDFVEQYFTGTASKIEGIGLAEVAEETVQRHRDAFGEGSIYQDALDVGGELEFRLRGEEHIWTSETISTLQRAVRAGDRKMYDEFSHLVDEKSRQLMNLRGLFKFKPADAPVALDEVEPASEIVKRFCTGAMSFGSISYEAHTTLAIAMNRLGGKSNTGEGGEEAERFQPMKNGDSMRSAIKQVASGRFGVTAEYLANSDEMQIKMAQGAKPGEGGQLPGHKVDPTIAHVRHSTPGVGLISPPPHHDIYSIEDLKQLIFDLKNVNPDGDVSVKLVSEVGVGTVAAGVAKARADGVLISGYDGGTGASPLTSIMHAGSPWEIGLAETHQTLVTNDLRGRIKVQVDGGMRTGRDIAVGAILGADEFGIATAALISEGCLMMRKCHLNTCPAGIATQNPELRRRFTGKPEHVVNYLTFIAEEVREIMARMGFRTINEMIGRVDRLDLREASEHWKAHGLDLSSVLHYPKAPDTVARYKCQDQDHDLEGALDFDLIEQAKPALENKTPVKIETPIRNVNRAAGAMLSGQVAKRYGHKGLPEDTIYIKAKGNAGQTFGGWLAHGVTLDLEGDANDYVGKGLSGGRIVVRPPAESPLVAEENIIIGNTVLYGAISGECYFRGVAGERFCVRNSGALTVVEGVGDHGCEYMTGGVAVVLGKTGRNFAAGMSGGVAYVLDEDGGFAKRCNTEMVTLEELPDDEMMPDAIEKDFLFNDMLSDDAPRLKWLIERHLHYTGSAVARRILDDWEDTLPKFVKVLPVDYRKALEKTKTGGLRPRERAGDSPREG